MGLFSQNGIYWAALAGLLSLVGCVSVQQQQAAVSKPEPVPVRPVPVAVPVAVRAPPVIQKTAASGVPVTLDSASSVDPECHSNGTPTARVSQTPTHGTVKLLRQEVYSNFPPSNPRFACNKTKTPGIVAQYTSEPGFVGSDLAAVDVIFPDGKELELKFAISVK